jgi:hypothetical protein
MDLPGLILAKLPMDILTGLIAKEEFFRLETNQIILKPAQGEQSEKNYIRQNNRHNLCLNFVGG